MGLLSKMMTQQREMSQETQTPVPTPPPVQNSNELSRMELELLLKIMADATLKGRDVEVFYHMILKIQSQYIAKQQ